MICTFSVFKPWLKVMSAFLLALNFGEGVQLYGIKGLCSHLNYIFKNWMAKIKERH